MKKFLRITSVLLLLFWLASCKKDAASGTRYTSLGSYNSAGLPSYLMTSDSISPQLSAFIDSLLPNGINLSLAHPELFDSTSSGDIAFSITSDVYMTFVSQASGLTNSIAFYTYPTNQPPASINDIKQITYIFPNAGYLTALTPGDKVKVGTFAAGTSIGFILLNNAWNTANGKLDNNAVHWATNDNLNAETNPSLKRHAVIIHYARENKLIIGFEDTDRSSGLSDNDFNDVVVYLTICNRLTEQAE